MAKSATQKAKVTYTYNGITFSTASKVVAKRWASGNQKGAYARYVSDTIGRALRKTGKSKDYRMGAEKRLGLLRDVESGVRVRADVETVQRIYNREVQEIIAGRIEKQYQEALSQLRHSKDEAVRDLAKSLRKVIHDYADRYRADNHEQIQSRLSESITQLQGKISEQGMRDLLNVKDSVDQLLAQQAIKKRMEKSRLKDRD